MFEFLTGYAGDFGVSKWITEDEWCLNAIYYFKESQTTSFNLI